MNQLILLLGLTVLGPFAQASDYFITTGGFGFDTNMEESIPAGSSADDAQAIYEVLTKGKSQINSEGLRLIGVGYDGKPTKNEEIFWA